jgi:16S rRNA A1518/A1519 N6-dimethyltransferase RsmA/KsgA/DIM1 with predicted DNA glycosylase/AP lyase activity
MSHRHIVIVTVINVSSAPCNVPYYFCHILAAAWKNRQVLVEIPDRNFHPNPSSKSRVIFCGRVYRRKNGQTEGQRDGRTFKNKVKIALSKCFFLKKKASIKVDIN